MSKITIFTPTYNRAKLLLRLYKSLKNQSSINFEWVIVDDGSCDNTKQVVNGFIEEDAFPINYIYQNNKGKHFAINRGVKEAKGELFWIVDSDDYLPTNAIAIVQKKYNSISDNPNICGVAGRCIYKNGEIVGNEFAEDIISTSIDIRYKKKVTGDLAEVFKTSVMKEYPFPEIKGEKFCPEALLWNRIAQVYQLLFFNIGIYIADYQVDGLTSNIVNIRMKSPVASMLTYSELASYTIPLVQKAKAFINFWRFSFNSTRQFSQKWSMMSSWFSIIAVPIGYLLFLRDKNNHNTTQG